MLAKPLKLERMLEMSITL